jgi:hypothetical protein
MPAQANGQRPPEREVLYAEMARLIAPVARKASQRELVTWYLSLASCWLGATPRLRRRLLLRTHQWIAERVMSPDQELRAAAEELEPGGALTRALTELVPSDERDGWRNWIRLVVTDLRRALRRPLAERNEAWAHWLFLIPYSVPLSAAVNEPRS